MKGLRYTGAICIGLVMMIGSIFLQWNFTEAPIESVMFMALMVYITGVLLGLFLFQPVKKHERLKEDKSNCPSTNYTTKNTEDRRLENHNEVCRSKITIYGRG